MKLLVLFLVFYISKAQAYSSCSVVSETIQPPHKLSVEQSFIEYGIVDDYLPVPPKDEFLGAFKNVDIKLGTIMSPFEGYFPEFFRYPKAEEGQLYTLVYLDLDPPPMYEKSERAEIYVMSANLPGGSLNKPCTYFGDIIVAYRPMYPKPNTGLHRYIALIYKQKYRIDVNSPDLVWLSRYRTGFSVVDFAKNYSLGYPLAGNFIQTEFVTCDHV